MENNKNLQNNAEKLQIVKDKTDELAKQIVKEMVAKEMVKTDSKTDSKTELDKISVSADEMEDVIYVDVFGISFEYFPPILNDDFNEMEIIVDRLYNGKPELLAEDLAATTTHNLEYVKLLLDDLLHSLILREYNTLYRERRDTAFEKYRQTY